MASLVISFFPLQLRPPPLPSRLRSQSLPSRLRPPSPPLPLRPPSPPSSRLRPPTLPSSRLRPPTQLQLRPPDPPPSSPLEARSPPKPPDPPNVPFILVLPLLFDIASSQLFSKTLDLKSPLLDLVPMFSDGAISLVYVGDISFVSKCLFPAVCSMVLYWYVDWSRHVIVFVDSTLG
ncbi:hypothetical protein Bca4012_017802 [Brassica carinata]